MTMNPRLFLFPIVLLLTAGSFAPAENIAGPWPAPNNLEAAAMEKAREAGAGTIELIGPDEVTVRSHQTWTLRYTAGSGGLARGGSVYIGMRHMQHLACPPQTDRPAEACYVTASGPPAAKVACEVPEGTTPQFFAWQHMVRAIVTGEALQPGESLDIVLGDTSRGGPGMRVQPFDETRYMFKTYVDIQGDDTILPLPASPAVAIIAAEPALMNVVMPSDAVAGAPTWCLVRAEDVYGNPAEDFRGTVALSSTDDTAELPAAAAFTAADRGVRRFEGVIFNTEGVQTIRAASGEFEAASNPVIVTAEQPEKLLLWGDLHGHTLFSDGRGTVEEFYDFAERVAGLDFCAVTDHAFEVHAEMWEHSKKVTNAVYKPGRFVTFNAFEWSGRTPLGGDHNVFFLEDDPPIFRSTTMYDARNLQIDHEEAKYEHVTDVFAEMQRRLKDKNIFCIPHFGGRKGHPDFHAGDVQRNIEVFSEHQRSEGWATEFLTRGYRLGIMASTDGHYGNPGYGYLKYPPGEDALRDQEIGMASVAVYAPERTRESVFESLYDRRVYATSGDRIVLDMTAAGHPMGSEFAAESAPRIRVNVTGTAPVTKVEFKKDSAVAHVETPGTAVVRDLTWRDPGFDPGATSYYYVRVVQANGEEAITSPVWVN